MSYETNTITQILGSEKDDTFKGAEIYVVAAFIGAGGAGMLINSLSITAELIGKNKQSSAFVYGAISLVDKISNGLYFLNLHKQKYRHYGGRFTARFNSFRN